MLLIVGFINGSFLLISFLDEKVRQDTWLVIIFGFIVAIPFVASYILLSRKFSNKNLIQINDLVYGKIIGKLISVFYIIFFGILVAYNYRQIVDFYLGYILSETPDYAIYIVLGLLCAYAVSKGINTIAKTCLYTVAFAIFSAVGTTLLMLGKMDFTNFLPIFESSAADFSLATYISACIPYCEIVWLLMVLPYVKSDKKIGKYVYISLGLSMLILLTITVRNISSLGASGAVFMESSFQSVRLINIGEFLTRMELFVALVVTASMFVKISILEFIFIKSFAQLFNLKTHKPYLLPFTALFIVLAIISFDSTVDNISDIRYYVVFAMPFEFIIPLLSLLVAKLRRLPRTGVNLR